MKGTEKTMRDVILSKDNFEPYILYTIRKQIVDVACGRRLTSEKQKERERTRDYLQPWLLLMKGEEDGRYKKLGKTKGKKVKEKRRGVNYNHDYCQRKEKRMEEKGKMRKKIKHKGKSLKRESKSDRINSLMFSRTEKRRKTGDKRKRENKGKNKKSKRTMLVFQCVSSISDRVPPKSQTCTQR